MKKNFLKGAALAAMVFAGFTATAQEESKGIELSGSVDAFFRANLNSKNNSAGDVTDGADGNAVNAPSTSFVNQDGFSVGMVNLIASKQAGKVGFVADLAFGPRGNEAVSGIGSSSVVNQLFVTYDASDAVTLTFGRFNTFLGYEVISPTGNFNYSTSYMFTNGPFSHTGLKADFSLDDNWSIGAAIMNSTDSPVDANVNGKLTGGLQVGYSQDSGSAYLNFLYGRNGFSPNETFQVDLTTGWDVAEDFYLGLNATYNDTDKENGFYGVALYPQYAFSDTFSIGARGEYYATTFDASNVDDDKVLATTLTASYSVGNLTIKPEVRWDKDGDKFVDNDGKTTDSLFSAALGAIYSF